jgi:hypothetical protein
MGERSVMRSAPKVSWWNSDIVADADLKGEMANSYRYMQLKCGWMVTSRNLQAGAFAGTAEAYFRYRPPYPKALLAALVTQARLPGSAVLLDLACGPVDV